MHLMVLITIFSSFWLHITYFFTINTNFKLRSHKLEKKTTPKIIYIQYHEYSLFLTNKPVICFCFGTQIKSKIQNSDKVRLHHLVTWWFVWRNGASVTITWQPFFYLFIYTSLMNGTFLIVGWYYGYLKVKTKFAYLV